MLRHSTTFALFVVPALAFGCAATSVSLASEARGTLSSDTLPVAPGNLAWAAEGRDGEESYAHVMELDLETFMLSSYYFRPATGETMPDVEMRVIGVEGAHYLELGDTRVRVDLDQTHLVIDGRRTALEAVPSAVETPIQLPLLIGEAVATADGEVSGSQASIIPRKVWKWLTGSNTCCIDCYNAHRSAGIPESMDSVCCGFSCESWEFPCDPLTSRDGCECDPDGADECLPDRIEL
jgi:hypothetical protein